MGIWSLCFRIWIQSSHSFVVCIWTNAGISLKASPFHQVSHPFWGQNGLPTFCSYLGELKGKMGKEDLRVLKAFQDINVFSRKSDRERQSLLKSFDSVFTDWQMCWWSDEVKSSSRVVFWTGGHLVLNRCWHVFWYSYTYIYICNLKNMYIYITYW